MNKKPVIGKITKFDVSRITTLRPVIEEAVKWALVAYGLEASLGSIKYDDTSFTGALKVSTPDSAQQAYARLVKYDKLRSQWFGTTFTFKSDQYKIVGARNGRSKYSVETVRLRDQKQYFFTPLAIRRVLDAEGIKNEEREKYSDNLRMIDTGRTTNRQAYPEYAVLDGSWIGKVLPNGAKVVGLTDGPWTPASHNAVVTESERGAFGHTSIANFINLYVPKSAAA
jgi:hypothetical protein